MDDILSLALESSGIPSEPGKQGTHGVVPNPSLEALFSVPSDRSGPDVGALLATASSSAPTVQEREMDSGDSTEQSTATSELPPMDINPFASTHFGGSKKFSLEEVLDVVLNEPPAMGAVKTNESTDIAQLFHSSSPLEMDSSLSSELDMALNSALFGSTDLPSNPSDSRTALHDTFLPSCATSMPQMDRQTPASVLSAARYTVATPSPLVHSTVATWQPPYSAMTAPVRGGSQPAFIPGVAAASSRTPGLAPAVRPPL